MTTPPPGPPARTPGGGISRPILGVPAWGWIVIIGAGVGAYVFIRARSASSAANTSTATTAGVSTTPAPADQQIGLTQYEQISAELVGIEGTDQALLAAIKDLQGAKSTKGDKDHDCPAGHHWDEKTKRCVKNKTSGGGTRRVCPKGEHWDDKTKRCVKDHAGGSTHHDVKVPDVQGQTRASATRNLDRAGLKPRFRRPFIGNEVRSERPAAGRRVRRGSTVTLAGRNPGR